MFSHPKPSTFARSNESGIRPRIIRAIVALVTTTLIAAPLIAASPATATAISSTVDLGAATGYSVLGHETVTNTGKTVVGGDLGVSPGTAVTGFGPGVILANGGHFHSADASAAAAQAAVTTAYLDAEGRTPTVIQPDGVFQFGGKTFLPGVYKAPSAALMDGTVTLDGGGDSNSIFIFQMGSTLTTAAGSSTVPASIVKLVNGAKAANVFWQVGSSATLGTYSYFSGTIMALASVTVTTGAHINGRTFARTGAVTLDDDDFATPPSFSPTIAITSPNTTTSVTPTISGTISAPTGSTVSVSIKPSTGPAVTVQATVTGGAWSAVSPKLVGGTYAVVATVTELDGSIGTATQTLTVDHTGPAVTITAPGYSKDSSPTLSGTVTAPTGSTVSVTVKALVGNFVETLPATVTGANWTTISPKLADGPYTVDATVTNPLNETGSAAQQSLTVYTETPLVTIAPLGLTNNPTPTIAGTVTAPAGSTVTVTITPSTGVAIILPATVTGSTWSVTSSKLVDGFYTVDATVVDPAGNTGQAEEQTLTVFTAIPLITIASLGLTNNPTPTISGTVTAPTGSTVTVTITPSTGAVIILPATVSGSAWSVTSPKLSDGSYTVDATVVDPAGNIGNAVQQSLTVYTTTPLITIAPLGLTNDSTPTISGTVTAPAGSTVSVIVKSPFGTVIETLPATVSGSAWSVTSPKLSDGSYTVDATVVDPAGNIGNAVQQSLTVYTTTPLITIAPLGLTNDSTPTISGTVTAPTGSAVTVTITPSTGAVIILPATVSGSTWSVTSPTLSDGSYTVDATVIDPAGNTGKAAQRALTIDTTKPTIAITSANPTNSATPTLSGTVTAPTGSTVSVTVASPFMTREVLAAVVTGGTWTTPSSVKLADGLYDVVATVTTPANNTSTDTQSLLIDTALPTITITSANPTNDPTPTISGTVTAPAGSTVTVVITPLTGAAIILPATVTGSAWSVDSTKLADGTYAVVATVITPANNTNNASQALLVDTTAPIVTINPLGLTNNATPTIAGTANLTDGATVSVTITPVAGVQLTIPATVLGGIWSFTAPNLADGAYMVGASATDPAGNTGTATPRSLTVDTTVPLVTITPLGLTNDATPTISGTVTATTGSTVVATVKSKAGAVVETLPATVTDNTWSVVSSKLVDGSYTVDATVTDPAGTTGTAVQQSLTIDTALPTITITSADLTKSSTPTISGKVTAPTGSTVTVVITPLAGAAIILPATVTGSTWSVRSSKLADGTYAVVATVITPARNTNNANQELAVDTTAPIVTINPLGLTKSATPTISGTVNLPDASIVSVTITPVAGVQLTIPATVQGGIWSFIAPELTDGTYTVGASGTDKAGNTGRATPRSLTVDTIAPIVTINSLGLTKDATPTISGTVNLPNGSIVSVTITPFAGTPITVPATVHGGIWTVTAAKLADGTYTVDATATDPAGNIGRATPRSLTIDTTAPIVTIDPLGLTKDETPTISGTANVPDGSVVTVKIAPHTGPAYTLPATVTGGIWSLVVPKLADGTYTIGATATDPAGNIGRAAPQPLTIDTIAPLVAIAPLGLTNNPTPIISGTAGVQDGALVTVTITPATGAPVTLTATVARGTWSVPSPKLADGPYTVTATAVDLAGNIGSAAPRSLTVDTTAPVLSITSPALTNVSKPTISGTASGAPDGTVVTVVVRSSTGALIETLTAVVTDGKWSAVPSSSSPTLADGTYSVTATAADSAGNVGTATGSFVINTVKPLVAITSSGEASISTPTISGTTNVAVGSTVTVTVDGVTLSPSPVVTGSSAPAVASLASLSVRVVRLRVAVIGGTWTIVSSKLANGIHAVVATVTDPAGNVGRDAQNLTVSSALTTLPFDPPTIAITSPATSKVRTPTISGTTFDVVGSVITVSVDGVNLPTTVPTTAGTWAVVSRTLSVGSHAVVATIVNAHGSAVAIQTLTISVQLSTQAFDPASGALASTGGNVSGGIWGLLFAILGALVLAGRSILNRPKSGKRAE